MKKLFLVTAVLALLCMFSAASAATYGTVTATVAAGYGINMASMIGPYDTSWWSGWTGQFNYTYSNMNPVMPLTHEAYCIEVETVSWGGSYNYSIVDAFDAPKNSGPADTNQGPMGLPKALYVSELWGRFHSQVNSNVAGAAFSLATYEIVFEDLYVNPIPWSMSTGRFQARSDGGDSTAAINLATSWLGQIDGLGPKQMILGLSQPGIQDVIVAVPEPSSIIALLGGLGSLLAFRRRRA